MIYPRQILNTLKKKDVHKISKVLHYYFNLVETDRIYELILQVDSIDTALHLLICHKQTEATLDSIVYDYLHYVDERKA